jgi:hypothetical protein
VTDFCIASAQCFLWFVHDVWRYAQRHYVFPLLHKTKKEGVADALSKAIKKYIKKDYGNEMSKLFSPQSLRKAAMTHNRANHTLSTVVIQLRE